MRQVTQQAALWKTTVGYIKNIYPNFAAEFSDKSI
jgi:hypothetical protein